jgi:hypothetical protein
LSTTGEDEQDLTRRLFKVQGGGDIELLMCGRKEAGYILEHMCYFVKRKERICVRGKGKGSARSHEIFCRSERQRIWIDHERE